MELEHVLVDDGLTFVFDPECIRTHRGAFQCSLGQGLVTFNPVDAPAFLVEVHELVPHDNFVHFIVQTSDLVGVEFLGVTRLPHEI